MKIFQAILASALILAPIAASAQTVSAPKSLQLTVYNGNFALVKDTRTINLTGGVNSIEVETSRRKSIPPASCSSP